MKKAYKKPQATIEFFALTQAIAACDPTLIVHYKDADCIYSSSLPDQWFDLAVNGMFADNSCSKHAQVGADYAGVCFHTNASPTFTS